MLAQGLAKQVQKLHFTEGYSPDQIAESLRLDVGEVAHAIVTAPDSVSGGNRAKSLLAKHVQRAAEVQGELLEDYENPRIQLEASRFILEVEMGKHDKPQSPTENNISLNQFNVILQQSNTAYEDQLAAAGIIVKPGTPPLDIETKKE